MTILDTMANWGNESFGDGGGWGGDGSFLNPSMFLFGPTFKNFFRSIEFG